MRDVNVAQVLFDHCPTLSVCFLMDTSPVAVVSSIGSRTDHVPHVILPSWFPFFYCHRPDIFKEEMKKIKGTEEEEVD